MLVAEELARQLDEQGRSEMATSIRLKHVPETRPAPDHDPNTVSEEAIELIRRVAVAVSPSDFAMLRNTAKLILAGLERRG